ncbi:hypothetical protein TWF694_010185 [Orbilia ellipsospora]|uniref:Ribosomal protein L9 domain-containing protein n=1 Tax=Orbilia ellipsospora TaxID=2528407 RepID=A0AAV9X960_9PEZI
MSPPPRILSAAVSTRLALLSSPSSSSLSAVTRTALTGWQQQGPKVSICGDCLRSLGQSVFIRGKKKLPKAIGVKVRLLKDIPNYGPKGVIMMVAPGRMRTLWYPRSQAEYLTRELEDSLGKYTLVERDPGYKPFVPEKPKEERVVDVWGQYHLSKEVQGSGLPPYENIAILKAVLPPSIRFYKSTITPHSDSLHGSVTATDVAGAIKAIAAASEHVNGNRVVVTAENITFSHDKESGRVKELGQYEVVIGYKGEEEKVTRTVYVIREDDEGEAGGIVTPPELVAPPPPSMPQGGNIFGGSGAKPQQTQQQQQQGGGRRRSEIFAR